MTAAPPTIGMPVPPQPQPPRPPRKPGFGWAMALAIVVTALPVILVPVYVVGVLATTFATIAAVQSEVRDQADGTGLGIDSEAGSDPTDLAVGPDLPVDLPFDVEVPEGVYAGVNDTLTAVDAWTPTTEGAIGYLGYTNASTGCAVSYENGSLPDEIDRSQGDQATSHGFIEWMFDTEPDPDSFTTSIVHGDVVGEPVGEAEAVIEYFTTDASQIAVIARTFSPAGEGVMIYVECPTTESLDEALSGDVATHLTLSLI
ncbi:hypothetical protein FLP10_05890 [Agromyces intestinalis]|uniref:Uncharacterized protein n=1 Tax=Agromyces intestinalis TaxID=2592652 RepID=A0A5C1YEU6_9MICO|nr:hypothetical protein [Agromyces intestinalis]QEO14005.1 hypothetical protein FLP10_05890 [Agromyces intestinalis]